MIVFGIIFLIIDCKLILYYVTFMLIYCCELLYYTFVYMYILVKFACKDLKQNDFPFYGQ